MKYENKTKAELAEAYLHCFRVKALLENGGEFDKSYEDLKKECYESLIENFSAVDIICKIKELMRAIEKNIHIAPLEDWWMPTTPNHLMPSIPMPGNNKQDPKPWDNKFMCGLVPNGVGDNG
jgi:hypothetical protein